MLQYLKRQAMKLRSGLTKGIVLLLCLATLFSSAQLGGLALIAEAAEGDTVTVTVNYVYKSNSAMVAQPYTAQIAKGAAFKKTIEVPYLFNYSIPVDEAKGLGSGIELNKDSVSNKYSMNFNLPAVNEDITVTLYYVAGTAKYTVKHYYQNLEDGSQYTMDPTIVELTGDIDAYTEAVANNKPGFRCKGIPQTTIAADGTTVVEIYYDREYYTVVFDVNGGINGPEPIYAKYDTTFKVSDIQQPNRKGYVFEGWFDPDRNPIAGDVAIEGNVTYTAQWRPEKAQADYTIVLWGQNANDDEYSYLSSYGAWGNVGNQVTWNEDTLISHVHTDDCWDLTCGKEEHTHSAACYGNCTHVPGHALRPDCFGLATDASAVDPNNGYGDNDARTHFEDNCNNIYWGSYTCKGLKQYLKDGSVCQYKDGNGSFPSVYYSYYYFLYLNGQYYEITQAQYNSLKSNTGKSVEHGKDTYYVYEGKTSECNHTHTAACLTCNKPEHKHSSACGKLTCGWSDTPKEYMRDIRPDSKLWNFKTSDTVTVDANGSTVLNVYFDRTTFTLTFNYRTQGDWDDHSGTKKTEYISERWGANILDEYNQIKTNSNNGVLWSESSSSQSTMKYTSHFEIMPSENATYYLYRTSGSLTNQMRYYCDDLKGVPQLVFSLTFNSSNRYFTVSEKEDYYEFEGFTIDRNVSAKENDSCKDAKFYYTRNSYNLEFYSASKNVPEQTNSVKYQAPLGEYNYVPTKKPATVEAEAIFVGWYQNPECTGEPFDLSAHVMPSHDIALYAKWVNGLFRVRTFTDKTMTTPYTYDGYNGVQENIVKYTLATAPADPKKDGYQFIGWFYKDGEAEKPFSFTMPITKDYNLYPKFSEPKEVTYTVHYYKQGTTEQVADDRTNYVMIGTTVTEKAKMGADLNLVEPGTQNKYYPTNTSTSVIINQIDQEIIFYYTEATNVKYTVYYQDANGKDLRPPKTENTEYSTVTEQYVPINGYAPRQFSITQDLTANSEQNKIIFIYDPTLTTLTIQKQGCEDIDEKQTFLFHVKGSSADPNTEDIDLTVTVHGNGQTTVTDLPVGNYTVTEETEWSWRYTPDGGADRTFKAAIGGTNLVYQNSRTQTQWLDGDNYRVNHFDSKNQ